MPLGVRRQPLSRNKLSCLSRSANWRVGGDAGRGRLGPQDRQEGKVGKRRPAHLLRFPSLSVISAEEAVSHTELGKVFLPREEKPPSP